MFSYTEGDEDLDEAFLLDPSTLETHPAPNGDVVAWMPGPEDQLVVVDGDVLRCIRWTAHDRLVLRHFPEDRFVLLDIATQTAVTDHTLSCSGTAPCQSAHPSANARARQTILMRAGDSVAT
jgi:hypothetical protein